MKNGFPNNVGRHVTDWEIILQILQEETSVQRSEHQVIKKLKDYPK